MHRCTPTAPIPAARCAKATSAKDVRLSGWVHRKRDHGGLLFIDLRDHYGLTQLVADPDSPGFKAAESLRAESVIRVDGEVRERPEDTRQPEPADRRDRGVASEIEVLSAAEELPLPVFGEPDYPEDLRLKYRYLDLRRETLHRNIVLRNEIIRSIRRRMIEAGLPRVPDADPDRLLAGRRARLPGAVAPASRQVLRAAAGAAAVQAADDGRGLRPLLPDRALLPRRGRARRPLARRVLPARRRDELRHAGGRVRRHRARDARRVRGVRRRQAGDARSSRASPTARRSPSTAPTSRTCATRSRCRTSPSTSAAAASGVRPHDREGPEGARCGRSRRRAAAAAPSATG